MKKAIMALAIALATTATATAAERGSSASKQTQRVKLTSSQLDKVVAGKITPVKVNGGGNTPNGQANGVPSENQNPSGHAPPGQN